MTILSALSSFGSFVRDYCCFRTNQPSFENIIINITAKCNLDCVFCECCDLDSKNDLSYEEIKEFFGTMANRGSNKVFLGGGEPFMRKDIWKILKFLKKREYKISAVSNGMILADSDNTRLEIINETIEVINISLDSSTAELHNSYRNNNLAYEKALKAIRRLLKLDKTNVLITTIITAENFNELPEMVKLTKKIGGTQISFQPFSEATNFPDLPPKQKQQHLVPKGKIIELKMAIDDTLTKAEELKIMTNLNSCKNWIYDYFENKGGSLPIHHKMVDHFECILPFRDLYVRHNGDIQLCALLPKISSIREKKFDEVIKDIKIHTRNITLRKFPPECQRCFCGLDDNIYFSILSHPYRNYPYFKRKILSKITIG